MRKAVLLHGTDGTPGEHWLGWLHDWLKAHSYKVFEPQLPNCHTPNREEFSVRSGLEFYR